MKNRWIRCVEHFHRVFGHPVLKQGDGFNTFRHSRKTIDEKLKLREDLITEEYFELRNAIDEARKYTDGSTTQSIPEKVSTDILDAIVDLTYVLVGTAVAMGYDMDGAFREVHRSNMSKLGADGKPIYRSDGKVVKSELFTPPNLIPFVRHREDAHE